MKFGLPISFSIHFLAVFGGIFLWNNSVSVLAEIKVIPLEIVTVSEKTNVKQARKEPPKEEPKEVPALLKPEVLVEPEPEPSSASPETKTAAFDLDALANMVDKARLDKPETNVQKPLIGEVNIAKQNHEGTGERSDFTISAPDYIKTKMKPCWPVDRGAKNYKKLRVEVRLQLDKKGEIIALSVLNSVQIIASPNNAWRAARDKVISALNECSPYSGLVTQDYDEWKSMKLNFQPGDT